MNAAEIDEPYFMDTNILVYSLFEIEPIKRSIASALVRSALVSQLGSISTQVVQEFLNVAVKQAKPVFSREEATDYLRRILWPLCRHYPSLEYYDRALSIQQRTGYAYYDALIVTAAVDTDCRILLTEDMQHGRVIDGLTIVNPFLDV